MFNPSILAVFVRPNKINALPDLGLLPCTSISTQTKPANYSNHGTSLFSFGRTQVYFCLMRKDLRAHGIPTIVLRTVKFWRIHEACNLEVRLGILG